MGSDTSTAEATRPASDVKSSWRDIVAEAKAQGEVVITNHSRPEVVVVSIERYEELSRQARANDPLQRLRAEFDEELEMLGNVNTPSKLRKAFRASPRQIAKAANAPSRNLKK